MFCESLSSVKTTKLNLPLIIFYVSGMPYNFVKNEKMRLETDLSSFSTSMLKDADYSLEFLTATFCDVLSVTDNIIGKMLLWQIATM